LGDHIVPDFFNAGDYWVVKSAHVEIQGRYGGGLWALDGLAFGGEFLQNHRLVIDRMWDGTGRVSWDGQRVSVRPEFANDLVQVSMQYDRAGRFFKASAQLPEGVALSLERGSWNGGADVNAYITMRKQSTGQDGHCGRADGSLADDTTRYLERHWGAQVPQHELLFDGAALRLLGTGVAPDGERAGVETCATGPPSEEASEACAQALNGTATALADALRPGCLFDVCAGGSAAARGVATAAAFAAELLLAAGAPPAPAEGWYDAGAGRSCAEGCREAGLVCTEEQLLAHNDEVDSSEEVLALLAGAGGGTGARHCLIAWGWAADVPNWSAAACHRSASSRSLSTFDCAARPKGGLLPKHRLCYCHVPAAAS